MTTPTFQPLAVVQLVHALESAGLPAGAQGTVLEVFRDGHCLVEFADDDGCTIADPILAPGQIAPVADI